MKLNRFAGMQIWLWPFQWHLAARKGERHAEVRVGPINIMVVW